MYPKRVAVWFKCAAASFKCVAAFSNVWQHGETVIIHFTFILILFLSCLFWYYLLFQCIYKSSSLFLYFCLSVLLYILSSCYTFIIVIWDTIHDVRWEVFEKFLRTKFFLVKLQTFSFQAFTFKAILPGILIPNSQTRHFPWSVI